MTDCLSCVDGVAPTTSSLLGACYRACPTCRPACPCCHGEGRFPYWTVSLDEFLDSYNLAYVGVDAHGMGSAVADRLERLLGNRCDVLPMHSDSKNQADRWKHLIALLQRRMLVYPGHSKARRTRAWRKFRQQMADAEKVMKGQYLLIQAPEERYAYDDYVDSLAIAAACSLNDTVPMVEVMHSPFYRGA